MHAGAGGGERAARRLRGRHRVHDHRGVRALPRADHRHGQQDKEFRRRREQHGKALSQSAALLRGRVTNKLAHLVQIRHHNGSFSIYVTVNPEYNAYIYSTYNQSHSSSITSLLEEEIYLVVGNGTLRNLVDSEEIQKFPYQVLDLNPSEIEEVLNFVFRVVPLQACVFKQVNTVGAVWDLPKVVDGNPILCESIHRSFERSLVGVGSSGEGPAQLNLHWRERYIRAGVP